MLRNKTGKLAIIDANLNRAREGLRVVEDIERFYYRSGKFSKIRRLRHMLAGIFKDRYEQLVESRNIKKDKGAKIPEHGRKNIRDALRSNIARSGESLRVLEEMTKLQRGNVSAAVKRIRFRLYEIEKEFVTGGGLK
ncbi:MAG: thiamine-phosphate pyrophosphorylase [bacterium]